MFPLTLRYLPLIFCLSAVAVAQEPAARITSISPGSGPEGTRIEILGTGLSNVRGVRVGTTPALYRVNSPTSITALVPMHASSAPVSVITSAGRAQSGEEFRVENDPRVPWEVRYKTGYVNIIPRPQNFNVALLWGVAIVDPRMKGYESAKIEIASTVLSCRIDHRDVILNRDTANVRGGLYARDPWFAGNYHERMPLDTRAASTSPDFVTLPVGERPDRIWHFWSASGRANIPPGHLDGCTTRARVRISPGALVQLGMDYWRDRDSLWAPHSQNNHEAGVSRWYFASEQWQEVVFTDIP